ncbi:porin [Parvibaculaceae bacterium PLY_AMNH_Bact1]|nr:porin [Parvibaculaceae bacterium PLY_AMNH_Bact1]
MKKTLLGTTALVSAGLVAGPALASDPLTVTVSGSVITGFYFVDNDSTTVAAVTTDYDDTKVAVVARNIDINAEGTLDNGLVAGANLKLQLSDDEGGTATDDATFSEVYAYLEGGFGRLELGATDGAAFKMHYTSPWFVPGNGVDSPNIYNIQNVASSISSRTSTFSLLAEDDNKISYFTPRLAGFQLGASFTPDTANNDPAANGFGVSAQNSSTEDVMEIALNYAGEFGGVSVGADVFYVTGEAAIPGADDPEERGVGASLGWGGFTLGGAYTQVENVVAGTQRTVTVASNGNETDSWTVGLAYGTGPWTVGAAYFESEAENTIGTDIGSNEFIQVGGGYSLGAGVDLGLDVQFIEDQAGAGATSVDSTSAGVVLAISF